MINVPRASTKEVRPRLVIIGIDEISMQASAVATALAEVAAHKQSAQGQTPAKLADSSADDKALLSLLLARSFDSIASGGGGAAHRRLPSSLVLRPASLAALKQLAREEFEWSARHTHTSNECSALALGRELTVRRYHMSVLLSGRQGRGRAECRAATSAQGEGSRRRSSSGSWWCCMARK